MAGATKTANVTWSGDLMSGKGTIDSVGSGAISNLGVTLISVNAVPEEDPENLQKDDDNEQPGPLD